MSFQQVAKGLPTQAEIIQSRIDRMVGTYFYMKKHGIPIGWWARLKERFKMIIKTIIPRTLELTDKQIEKVYFWNRKYSYYVKDNIRKLAEYAETQRNVSWTEQEINWLIYRTAKDWFYKQYKHRMPKYCASRLTIIDVTYDKRK